MKGADGATGRSAFDWARANLRRLVVLAVVLAVAGFVLAASPTNRTVTIKAWFTDTTGVYAGDEVRIQGVPVGTIVSIEPRGGRVLVTMKIDPDKPVPGDASAVILAPSLVSSRYVQLAPRYDGGARLGDGDTIPLERTRTPVEWDQIKSQLDDLAVALGPDGVNKRGALSRLIKASSGTLAGQGATINQTIADLSATIQVLDESKEDVFGTVRHLQRFVTVLAQSDEQIVEFTERLDLASEVLYDNRATMRSSVGRLADTVEQLQAFVKKNRGLVQKALVGGNDVLSTVLEAKVPLAQALHVAPNAVDNLAGAYDPQTGSIATGLHVPNIHSPGQLICSGLAGISVLAAFEVGPACKKWLGDLLDSVAGSDEVIDLLGLLLTRRTW